VIGDSVTVQRVGIFIHSTRYSYSYWNGDWNSNWRTEDLIVLIVDCDFKFEFMLNGNTQCNVLGIGGQDSGRYIFPFIPHSPLPGQINSNIR